MFTHWCQGAMYVSNNRISIIVQVCGCGKLVIKLYCWFKLCMMHIHISECNHRLSADTIVINSPESPDGRQFRVLVVGRVGLSMKFI